MNDELAKQVIFDDASDFESVTAQEISYQTRWSTYFYQIFKHKTTEALWRISWSRGSTEMQDDGPEDISYCLVEAKQVMVTEYVAVAK
jgi:hypothetical protein